MSRSTWKGPFIDNSLIKFAFDKKITNKPIKTWSRRSIILPEFLGQTFEIHNGHTFTKVKIVDDMIGHKLGEFSFTRKRNMRKKDGKNKR